MLQQSHFSALSHWVVKCPAWQLLGVVALMHAAGIGLFAGGFLLTRMELPARSSCADVLSATRHTGSDGLSCTKHTAAPTLSSRGADEATDSTKEATVHEGSACRDADVAASGTGSASGAEGPGGSCWLHPRFRKTVWVIVDALRFDFVVPSSNSASADLQMPYLRSLADQTGSAGSLMHFIADPPTTTMQRLKGILTGGLPTFIDVGSSFGASAIAEDNLIDQLAGAGRRLAFVGDDTWMQLFPHQFTEAHPYPSFNVQDLHTVDDGVWQFLLPALRNASGWEVLVAHYLGVDHAGHTHDITHPTMAAKLRQMDQQLQQVVEALTAGAGPGGQHEGTLLLVFGDHGQTMSGDHGGGTTEEVDCPLFALDLGAYARHLAKPTSNPKSQALGPEEWPVMRQVDFAPSLALLLGVPIPYGSIGAAAPQLWTLGSCSAASQPAGAGCQKEYTAALRMNAWQVNRYLNDYAGSSGASLPQHQMAQLKAMYSNVEASNGNNAAELQSKCQQYLEAAAQLAQGQWTQFHLPAMAAGIAVFATAVLLQLWSVYLLVFRFPQQPAASVAAHPVAPGKSVCRQLQAAHAGWEWGLEGIVAALSAAHAVALFSNSFVLAEGRIVGYLIASLILLLVRSTLALALQLRRRRAASLHPATLIQADGAAQTPTVNGDNSNSTPFGKAGPNLSGQLSAAWTAEDTAAAKVEALEGSISVEQDTVHLVWWVAVLGGTMLLAAGLLCSMEAAASAVRLPAAQNGPQGSAAVVADGIACISSLLSRCLQAMLPPGVAGRVVQWVVTIALPLAAVPLVVLQARLSMTARQPFMETIVMAGLSQSRHCQRGSSWTSAVVTILVWTAFTAVGLHWLTEQLFPDCSVSSLSELWTHGASAAVDQLPVSTFQIAAQLIALGCDLGLRVLTAMPAAAVQASTLWLQSAYDNSAAIAALPLHLLLPRTAYAAAATALFCSLLSIVLCKHNSNAQGNELASAAPLVTNCRGLEAAAAIAAPYLLVLGPTRVLAVLLAVVQGTCLCMLLGLRGRCMAELDGGGAPASQAGAGAGMWALFSLQLFFCTGHYCEFAGLQYTAGFAGLRDFDFSLSGALLALNTFGSFLLAIVTLPLLCLPARGILPEIACDSYARSSSSKGDASKRRNSHFAVTGFEQTPWQAQLKQALAVFSCVRAANALTATISAGIQRRHLMVWALFAPKYLFEVAMLGVSDVLLLLAAVILR